jgi:hypothetical protein
MAKKNSTTVKYLCDGSPKFKFDDETFQAKPGFNEMPEKFATDPYYKMCVDGKIIKDFVSVPTDGQQEAFDAQLKAEREKNEELQKQNEELLAQLAAQASTAAAEK